MGAGQDVLIANKGCLHTEQRTWHASPTLGKQTPAGGPCSIPQQSLDGQETQVLIPKRGLAIGRVQKSLSSTTLPSSLQLSIGLRNKPLVYCFSTIPCIRKQKGKKQNNPLQNLSILSNILLNYSQHSCTKACRTNKSKHMQTMLNVYQAKKTKTFVFLNSVEVAC